MSVELVVAIKNDEKRLVKNFLIYETFLASEDDPIVDKCIRETVKEFGDSESEKSVTVKIIMSVE